MPAALEHPLAVLIGAGVFIGLVALLWAAGKNWRAMRAVQEELHGQIRFVVEPMFDQRLQTHNDDETAHGAAITLHNRDEDAHEAAGIKVRKERQAMFDSLRDRMEEQHATLLQAITEVKTTQVMMGLTLSDVAKGVTTNLKRQEDMEREFYALKSAHNRLHGRRAGDMNGLTFEGVRQDDRPRRLSDPVDEDHRGERK